MKSKKKNRIIYADYASSFLPNPSAIHQKGIEMKRILEDARKEVANFLGARSSEIIFTSSGTESNNLAIQGIVFRALEEIQKSFKKKVLPHVIVSSIEHPSVLETVKVLLERNLIELSILPVDVNGILDINAFKKEIKKNTVLVSVMFANNEIGTLEPIKEIAKEIRHWKKHSTQKNIFGESFPILHTDAVQAVTYFDLKVDALGVDLLSLSGAKIKEGRGVGVLFKRRGVSLAPILFGGDQEFGLRAGTENVEAIVKFSQSLSALSKNRERELKRIKSLRDFFLFKLKKILEKNKIEYLVNGDTDYKLPNIINITLKNLPSDLLVIELSTKGIMISEKSACKSGDKKISHVIEAIRRENSKNLLKDFSESLRFSFGEETKKEDIQFILKTFSKILNKLVPWYR